MHCANVCHPKKEPIHETTKAMRHSQQWRGEAAGLLAWMEQERSKAQMRLPMRWTLRLVAVLTVSLFSILGTLIVVVLISVTHVPKPVPLTEGLTGTWAAASEEFDRRVRINFPVGSPVTKMAATLRSQGFTRQDWNFSAEQENIASRREDNIGCKIAAYVYWRADGEGHVTSIRGQYREEGCL